MTDERFREWNAVSLQGSWECMELWSCRHQWLITFKRCEYVWHRMMAQTEWCDKIETKALMERHAKIAESLRSGHVWNSVPRYLTFTTISSQILRCLSQYCISLNFNFYLTRPTPFVFVQLPASRFFIGSRNSNANIEHQEKNKVLPTLNWLEKRDTGFLGGTG